MLKSSRRRNLSRLHEWIGTDGSNLGKKHFSKRSILPRMVLRRKKFRLVVLMSTYLLGIVLFSSLRQKAFVLLCRLITSYLEAHCESEDVALWRGTHLEKKFPELDKTSKIDLVVSHCDLPIDWIFEWAAPLEFSNISIFSKCGKPVIGAPENAKIVRLENVGRCDHTYAQYMANYHSETNEKGFKNSDFVVFLKDNDNSHRNHYSRHKKLNEMIPLAKEFGFACHEETNWVWSKIGALHPICQISYYHEWASLEEFKVENYSRLRRDDNLQFQSQMGETLGDYAGKMGIKPHAFSRLINSTTVYDVDFIVPVCYGGNFMVQSEQILNRNPAFWERIESSLARSNNIAEGHFMERLWGTILGKPLQEDLVSRVLRQARYGVCQVEQNHLGALSK
jgi:hypothetical protein